MIKINDSIIKKEAFGDGTLKCDEVELCQILRPNQRKIDVTWCYDDDSELFLLICIVKHLREAYPNIKMELILPYIPNARQDRHVSNRIFTLKYFAEIINSLGFQKVYVLDPHSDVSLALIDRVKELELPFQVSFVEGAAYMFPDTGAAKKYAPRYKLLGNDKPFIIGNKHRDQDGRIVQYELLDFIQGTKKVIIRDDICSYGGTFVAAAKELRNRGVDDITLIVSHCENNIIKGEVFDYIDRVFTTDSICTVEHPKLIVDKIYRG